jgi:alcohol dehydrogenase (cytochrome c)
MKFGALISIVIIISLFTGCSRTDGSRRQSADLRTLSPPDSSYGSLENDWLTYGHDYGEQRFSPLTEISVRNVSKLTPVYVFHTGVIGAFETSPIVADGVMYLTTARDGVFAIDAKTGHLRWKRDPLRGNFRQCCGPVNRGVAIARDLVVLGQLDDNVVALDRNTGAVRWSTRIADNKRGYSISMAPLIFRDLVIVGVGGGDLGIRAYMAALSLRDGKLRWRWFVTDPQHWFGPSPRLRTDTGYLEGKAAAQARKRFAKSWMHGGGGIWTTPALEPARDTIYLTTGNPFPDLNGAARPGDNLFTDCIVALNATTGRMRWYFQEVPHDTMDLDAASPPVLFQTLDRRGKRVDALGEIGKTGVFYVLDRDSGKLIRGSTNVSSIKMPRDRAQHWSGGASWSPMSFDPNLGLVIVTATRHLAPAAGNHRTGLNELQAEWRVIYSTVSAVDVATGALVWQDEFDGGLIGGTVSTAGGVTFVGEGNGNFDALETRNGLRLWQFQTGAGVNAPPIIFSANGHEYVAVASGGNQQLGTPKGDALFAFRLSR